MFRKILIANRGEIALRVLRACRSLGVEAVVAYSEADRDSLPVLLADEAICIGPADATRSYLSAPAVISAALVTGSDAIHPGYGFLSEDEAFAEVVAAHGLTFIGPSAGVLERFASKEGTRRLLGEHGLPTIPGSDGMLRDEMHALGEAERIGYPVLIKPSAGGGGKGMRMVRTPRELESVLRVCRSEAKAAFGDDSLYLEKWLDENRHVEVQIAVDRYGHGVHLGERDCSVQRRHQKILEEAPSPALSEAARADLAERAVEGGRRGRVRERRDAGVPRRPRRELLLHRDQLPDPGGAPGDRDADRDRPRHDADPDRRRGAARVQPGRRGVPRPRPRVPDQCRGPVRGVPARRRRRRALPRARAARACGWTRTCTPATRCRLTTIRCWASSSSGARTGRPPSPAGRVALDELVVDGLVTNVAIHRALLANESFLEGQFTTNLLDRVGGAAILAAAARA